MFRNSPRVCVHGQENVGVESREPFLDGTGDCALLRAATADVQLVEREEEISIVNGIETLVNPAADVVACGVEECHALKVEGLVTVANEKVWMIGGARNVGVHLDVIAQAAQQRVHVKLPPGPHVLGGIRILKSLGEVRAGLWELAKPPIYQGSCVGPERTCCAIQMLVTAFRFATGPIVERDS
ncbi:hypothetical protein ABLE92_16245 [Gordonia sp. VNQ95]|uniref:hypothetical protein n=1 Tax=Gordonia sp. VNQ95 TaxID=3156619 RepID=UPI0032B53620